jgi:hypothetical protein
MILGAKIIKRKRCFRVFVFFLSMEKYSLLSASSTHFEVVGGQISERNSAKFPNETQPNYRTKLGQIAELKEKSFCFMFEFQIFVVILLRDKK